MADDVRVVVVVVVVGVVEGRGRRDRRGKLEGM